MPIYILLFGILTIYAAVFTSRPQKEFQEEEVLGASNNLAVFTLPEDGIGPVIEVLRSAQKEIFLEVYLLSDPTIIEVLKEMDQDGVETRVILEEQPFGGGGLNPKTREDLLAAGVETKWGNSIYPYTHQKSVVVDGEVACIMNLNLTKTAFLRNREYSICSRNAEEVLEVREIFLADWERREYVPKAKNLVVSPVNSRGKLKTFLESAKERIEIEMEILGDEEILEILEKKAKEVPIRVILPDFKKVGANKEEAARLLEKGVDVRTLTSPYVHAKMVLVDRKRAYVGSVNFSSQSMDLNRELGILVSQDDIIQRIQATFENDWLLASNI